MIFCVVIFGFDLSDSNNYFEYNDYFAASKILRFVSSTAPFMLYFLKDDLNTDCFGVWFLFILDFSFQFIFLSFSLTNIIYNIKLTERLTKRLNHTEL